MATLVLAAPSRRLLALRKRVQPATRPSWASTNHPGISFSSTASSSPVVQYALDVLQKLIQDRRDGPVDNPHRPQTSWERIRNFPEGVKALLRDCFRYKAIHDTPVNQWTVEYPNPASTTSATTTTTIQWNRIPRRQFEQQRQLRNDMRTMLPLVLVWIPPIIGFLPPLLAIVAPRQFMSRHFHNPYELDLFAHTEYRQRLGVYSTLADMLWSSFERSNRQVRQAMARSVSGDEEGRDDDDDAGPLLDAVTLYKTVFFHEASPVVPRGMYLSIKDLPREYLVTLSLAMGVNQYLPGWISPWVAEFQPRTWLQSQVDRIARVICKDDAMLIDEGHHLNECSTLTDTELLDACSMRGLPVLRPTADRRRYLTNHLTMVAAVREDPLTKPDTDGFRLFTVHLTPLRHSLKKNN